MRFVGQTELAGFLTRSPGYADTLRAWLAEMKHGRWTSAAGLVADFPNVDASDLPSVVFRLALAALRVETIIDFRRGIVLLVEITAVASLRPKQNLPGMSPRDH